MNSGNSTKLLMKTRFPRHPDFLNYVYRGYGKKPHGLIPPPTTTKIPRIFPSDRVANLFTCKLVAIISAGDKRFWLVDSGQRALKKNTVLVRHCEPSRDVMQTVHDTSCRGLHTVGSFTVTECGLEQRPKVLYL